jgi:hypothetical protein
MSFLPKSTKPKQIASDFKIAFSYAGYCYAFSIGFGTTMSSLRSLHISSWITFIMAIGIFFLVSAISANIINNNYIIKNKNKIVTLSTLIFSSIQIVILLMLGTLINQIMGTDLSMLIPVGLIIIVGVVVNAAIFYIAGRVFLKEDLSESTPTPPVQ